MLFGLYIEFVRVFFLLKLSNYDDIENKPNRKRKFMIFTIFKKSSDFAVCTVYIVVSMSIFQRSKWTFLFENEIRILNINTENIYQYSFSIE